MIFRNEDEKLKKRTKLEETDTFWNIGEITPPKKIQKSQNKILNTDTVLVLDTSGSVKSIYSEPVVKPQYSSELLLEYVPENPLISKVSIYSWPSKYTFYERFRVDAQKYFNVKHGEVLPVKYFSYMPSYIQMSIRQREWYFYWRNCVRNKKYLPADSSYILLYIYEIINLSDFIPRENGLEMLCDIWENYRKSYTKLDKFLSEWVCDYCLVNKLQPPLSRIASFYDRVMEESSFGQFYIDVENEDRYACLLFEKLSSYKWSRSKYINEDNKAVFEKHIRKGFAEAVKKLALSDGRFDGKSGRLIGKKIIRDAFSGSLCAYNAKRKIDIDYFDLENVSDLGFIVTDMVRYCENRVRAYLGIRARLSVQNLTEQQKNVINEYFDRELPCVFYEKKPRKVIEYEAPIEQTKPFEVSFEKAREIERESWQITDRLVEYEEYEEETESAVQEDTKEASRSLESESLDIAKTALICIANDDCIGFLKVAEECYMLPETLAECVNELCFEILGDIGIEEKNGGYALISDYEQEIRQWLNR